MEALAFENFVERVLSESLSGVHSVMADKYASLSELSMQAGNPAYPLALDEMLDFVKSILKVFALIVGNGEQVVLGIPLARSTVVPAVDVTVGVNIDFSKADGIKSGNICTTAQVGMSIGVEQRELVPAQQ